MYEIGDGVRRAKAAQMLGRETITVTNSADEIFEVAIESLRSPMKNEIKYITEQEILRFDRIYDGIKSIEQLPPYMLDQEVGE